MGKTKLRLMPRTDIFLFVGACLLLAIPGLVAEAARPSWMIPMGAGIVIISVAAVRSGLGSVRTALVLLVTLNLGYWLSYLLWRLKPLLVRNPHEVGIDPFAGPVAMWMLIFGITGVYQLVIFLRGLKTGAGERKISLVGLLLLAAQVLLTLRPILLMLEGV